MTTSEAKRQTSGRPRLLAIVLALAALVLALGAGSASAAQKQATSNCRNHVVNDWLQHQPNVKGVYPVKCYSEAIKWLQQYPDIQQYSNAPDDIHRAQLEAIRYWKQHPNGPGGTTTTTGPTTTNGSSSGPAGPGGGGNGPGGSGPSASGKGPGGNPLPPTRRSFITKLFDSVGPSNAQSIPLPLLVLGGLALLLLLAAGGTWLAKRLQARRIGQPRPAPAPVRRN